VERCRELRQRLGKPIWKALRIRSAADLTTALAYGAAVDALLLDAWVEGALGGTGQAIPLDLLAAFAPPWPWWLAGGITPERVPQVLAQVQPTGLDASSGVELAPGVKDLARVAALRAAISGSAPTPAA
jgi:phosphoribosylanthranilate isomerase